MSESPPLIPEMLFHVFIDRMIVESKRKKKNKFVFLGGQLLRLVLAFLRLDVLVIVLYCRVALSFEDAFSYLHQSPVPKVAVRLGSFDRRLCRCQPKVPRPSKSLPL